MGEILAIILSMLGIADAAYLSWEHYVGKIPVCGSGGGVFSDCGTVLTSQYAEMFGVPLAYMGFMFYIIEFLVILLAVSTGKDMWKQRAVILASVGFVMSLYFVYLQVFVIGALCLYCIGSASISTLLFLIVTFMYGSTIKILLRSE